MDDDFLTVLFGAHDPIAHVTMLANMEVTATAENNRISALKAAMASAPRCTRCGGTGILSQFMHGYNGICYGCGGTGNT